MQRKLLLRLTQPMALSTTSFPNVFTQNPTTPGAGGKRRILFQILQESQTSSTDSCPEKGHLDIKRDPVREFSRGRPAWGPPGTRDVHGPSTCWDSVLSGCEMALLLSEQSWGPGRRAGAEITPRRHDRGRLQAPERVKENYLQPWT